MKIVIKEVGVKSAFKSSLYLSSIPVILIFSIGIILTIVGSVFQNYELLMVGIAYIIMPIFLFVIYGLFGMLMAFVYNKLSGKFGGLEIIIDDERTKQSLIEEQGVLE